MVVLLRQNRLVSLAIRLSLFDVVMLLVVGDILVIMIQVRAPHRHALITLNIVQ